MADKKITELTNITGANLADADEFVVVDSSASETKAITRSELGLGINKLGYNGTQKIITTSTGVDVTGTVTADGLTSSGNLTFDAVAINTISSNGFLYYNVPTGYTHTFQYNGTNVLNMNGPDIYFYEDTGTTPKMVWKSADERLGIGTSSPQKTLEIASDDYTVNMRLQSNINDTPYYTDFQHVATDGFSINTHIHNQPTTTVTLKNGLVGIGTSSPSTSLLHLNYNSVNNRGLRLQDENGTYDLITSGGGNANSFGIYNDTAGAYRLFINSSGNVGIGTSSPTAQLELSSATDYSGLKVSGTNHKLITVETSTANRQALTAYKSGSHQYSLGLGTSDEFSLYDNTAATERLRIDSSGNVGIGVVPSAWGLLDAVQVGLGASFSGGEGFNDAFVSSNAYFDGSNWRYINSSTASSMTIGGSAAARWYIAPSGTAGNALSFTEAMRIDSSGNVGIGTSSVTPYANLVTTGIGGSQGGVLDFHASAVGTGYNRVGQIYGGNGGFLSFGTGASDSILERMRIDSSGNVGIGVVPSAWSSSGTWFRALDLQNGGALASFQGDPSTQLITNAYFDGGSWRYKSTNPAGRYYNGGNLHAWDIAASGTAGNAVSFTEAMRIDSSGNLLVGTTISGDTVGEGIKLGRAGYGHARLSFVENSTSSSQYPIMVRSTSNNTWRMYMDYAGNIYAQNTSIISLSDVRLKENIRDLDTGLETVMALRPRRFDWKDGKGADKKDASGFIAQEVEPVLPEIVHTGADEDEAGDKYKMLAPSNLIPTLVKAIQQQQALIEELKARVAALEA